MYSKNQYKTVQYKNIKVYFLRSLHGGGMDFGQDFIKEVKEKFGKVDSLCEFACGPGFIGFSLLAHGLCKKLCLIDVNPQAIECCKKTIKSNGLGRMVNIYTSDVLKNIPKNEKWDLVVSNPPMFNGTQEAYKKDIIGIDPGWRIHKAFYKDVSRHLNKNGAVLFVESLIGSDQNLWKKMIKSSRLKYIEAYQQKQSVFKLLKRAVKIIFAIRLNDIKSNFKVYKQHKNIKYLTIKLYSSYFVLFKKV